jgi:hypothetical protein
MHKLRINIYGQPKIVVKSPEVCFGIRQPEQVGHKNINIFSYKNLLGRFYTNGKQFI